GARVRLLVEYADRHREIERLLAGVKEANPGAYAEFATRLGSPAAAAPPQHPPEDVALAKIADMPHANLAAPAGRQADWVTELREQLQDADRIVTQLDTKFIELARGYADRQTLTTATLRQALVAETDRYFFDRVLLPRLLTIHGSVASASRLPGVQGLHADLP